MAISMNYKDFFARDPRTVARDLLGRTLVRATPQGEVRGKIIETGAYEAGDERPTRNGMSYAPGTIYVMPFRGNHFLNVATDRQGKASCVSIRGVELEHVVLDGPGKVGREFSVEFLDGELLGNELKIEGNAVPVSQTEIKRDGNSQNCLGYYQVK